LGKDVALGAHLAGKPKYELGNAVVVVRVASDPSPKAQAPEAEFNPRGQQAYIALHEQPPKEAFLFKMP
jgi:hypothetical protein